MKNFSLKVFAAVLLCIASGTICFGAIFQPRTQNAFTGAGTYCMGAAATALTFTYNTCSAGGGPNTGAACTITWYTNTTNSTNTVGATIVAGPTAFNSATTGTGTQTFTPPTATVGALYYFCVIKRTTTGCGGAANSTLPSTNTQLVTVNALPTTVVASGAGTFCGSTTITAANGGSGTIYFEGTTSNGTSTATPSTSQVVSASGTYYFRAQSASGCWGTQGSVVVVINPLPTTVTVTGAGAFCNSTTITAANGGSGTMYYEGTTSNGTSTATPSASQVISTIGTNTYYFRARSAAGCWSTQGSAVVTISPTPIVYAVTGGGAYCAGGAGVNVGLSNSQVGVNYQLYLAGSTVGAPVGGIGSAISFGPQVTAGTYTVVANPTLSCTTPMSGSAVITVNPAPAAILGANNVCVNSTVTLSDATGGGLWTSSFPGIASIDPNLGIVTGNSAGNTTITYTVTATGCTATAPFTVNALPAVAPIGGGTNECLGLTATLTETTLGGIWSSAAPATASISPVGLVTGNSLGTTTMSYTYTDGFGCTSIVTTPDTVNSFPVVDVITGPSNVCVNSSITLSDDSLTGVWSSSNTAFATIDPVLGVMTGVAAGGLTITYTVTNIFGCATSVTAAETVNPLPIVSAISGPTNECAGTTMQLSDASVGGTWSSSNTAIATVSSAGVVTGVAFGVDNISYTLTSIFGCLNSATYAVSIGNAMPGSAVLPADTSLTLCHGNPENLVVNTTGTGLTYQWYMNGSPITGAINGSYIATVPGQYYVQLNNGTCTLNLPYTDIIAPPNPIIGFNSIGPDLFTGNFSTYQWFLNGVAITAMSSGASSAVLPVSLFGSYTVVVSDANGCFDTSVAFVYPIDTVTTGITNVSNTADINIFPNPGTSIIHIDAPLAVNVSVMSTDGKIVFEQKNTNEINVGMLPSGMYIIKIYDENNTLLKTKKFTKVE